MTEKQETAKAKKDDWMLKLLAVVFAVMLWFYADAEQNPLIVKHFDVPIQYINQAEDIVVENEPQTVRVSIRGKETDLSSLRSDDFMATVDLRGVETGSSEYSITVAAPNGIDRFSYTPTKTVLQIDQMQTKDVPVRVRTIGSVPVGYDLTSTEVIPDQVTITGLSKDLGDIVDLETEAIDLSEITEEITREVQLHTPAGVTVTGDSRVAVHFLVQEKQEHHEYEVPIELRNVPENIEITLEQQSAVLILSGSSALLDSQQELNRIQLYVDCSGLEDGQHELPVLVSYSGSLTIGQIKPDTVMVTAENVQENSDTHINETNNNEGDVN